MFWSPPLLDHLIFVFHCRKWWLHNVIEIGTKNHLYVAVAHHVIHIVLRIEFRNVKICHVPCHYDRSKKKQLPTVKCDRKECHRIVSRLLWISSLVLKKWKVRSLRCVEIEVIFKSNFVFSDSFKWFVCYIFVIFIRIAAHIRWICKYDCKTSMTHWSSLTRGLESNRSEKHTKFQIAQDVDESVR